MTVRYFLWTAAVFMCLAVHVESSGGPHRASPSRRGSPSRRSPHPYHQRSPERPHSSRRSPSPGHRPLSPTQPSPRYTFSQPIWMRDGHDDYFTELVIGIPPQWFLVVLDTGASDTWVRAPGFDLNYPDQSRPGYNYSASSTSTIPKRAQRSKSNRGDAMGIKYFDYFWFGSGENRHQLTWPIYFLAADQMPARYDGVLGMSYERQNNLASNEFTVFLKNRQPHQHEPAGVLTIGKRDERNCNLTTTHFVRLFSNQGSWIFEVSEIKFGKEKYLQGYHTTTSTGSSHLTLHRKLANRIALKIRAEIIGDVYFVSCTTQKRYNLHFLIDKRQYTIPFAQIIKRIPGNNRCELLIRPTDGKVWIFGTPWARSYCQHHDWQFARLGFSRPIHS